MEQEEVGGEVWVLCVYSKLCSKNADFVLRFPSHSWHFITCNALPTCLACGLLVVNQQSQS